ncbi:MAG: hypothetical protein Q7K57_52320 [Burkholderiaceae bacterium]|nr:hypothetical protein [Burkholderiaceae bacterium]
MKSEFAKLYSGFFRDPVELHVQQQINRYALTSKSIVGRSFFRKEVEQSYFSDANDFAKRMSRAILPVAKQKHFYNI